MDSMIEELQQRAIKFRDEREWSQFHNPKDLAVSLSIEAGELLEWFQWKDAEEIQELLNTEKKTHLEEEIADVAIYLLLLCHETQVDLQQAIMDKIKKNAEKYPIDKSKGNAKKYSDL